ncbi:hypothetical protein IWQ62_001455 [Dispira parvispora]|uniref:THAP4-like heme-binding domain-containing protein n=1 Tax=Dispira parvispora TaxID=1520584 RepID=A0A9W8AW18_9FUNG|nr:hypothetical protein IWQ62_001455 [Dispira parvispora]
MNRIQRTAETLPPTLRPLAPLVGTWRGTGTIIHRNVAYIEELVIDPSFFQDKPIMAITQKTYYEDTGNPMHTETGYIRAPVLQMESDKSPVKAEHEQESSTTTHRDDSRRTSSARSSTTNLQSLAHSVEPVKLEHWLPPSVQMSAYTRWNLARNYVHLYNLPENENQTDTHYVRTSVNPDHYYTEMTMAYPFGIATVEAGWVTPLHSEGHHTLLWDTWCYPSESDTKAEQPWVVTGIARSATAKKPRTSAFRRILRISQGNTLHYEFYLQTDATSDLILHLQAELRRVDNS